MEKSGKRAVKLFWGVLCSLLTACISDSGESGSGTRIGVGDSLPAFSVRMHDGTPLRTEDLQGYVSAIVFFNTSCSDCRKELPVIQQVFDFVSKAFPGQVKLVCISREQDEASVGAYWRQHGLTLPYAACPDRSVYDLFAKSSIPRIYISGRNLVVRESFDDKSMPGYGMLTAAIENILAQ